MAGEFLAVCGDGTTDPVAGEQCDGGGETVSCDANCTARVCRDVYVNVVTGEQYDDGNVMPGDGCNATCQCGVSFGEVGCPGRQCPNRGRLVLYAGTTGVACANNGDCDGGTCDTGLGPCNCYFGPPRAAVTRQHAVVRRQASPTTSGAGSTWSSAPA